MSLIWGGTRHDVPTIKIDGRLEAFGKNAAIKKMLRIGDAIQQCKPEQRSLLRLLNRAWWRQYFRMPEEVRVQLRYRR